MRIRDSAKECRSASLSNHLQLQISTFTMLALQAFPSADWLSYGSFGFLHVKFVDF